MSTKYKFRDDNKLYFVSFSVIEWIDVFIRNEYKDILIKSFEFCTKEKGLEVYAYCIMTSHVHMIIGTHKNKLEHIIRDLKAHTSTAIRKAIEENPKESRREWMLQMMYKAGKLNPNNRDFQFWKQDNHPIELMTNEMLFQKLNYIHENPVKAGFVREPHHLIYSSATNYAGIDSIFKVILI